MPRDCYDCCTVPSRMKTKPKNTKQMPKRGGYVSSDCSCSDCNSWSDSCSCSDCEPSYRRKKKSSGKNKAVSEDDSSCSDCDQRFKAKKKTAPKRKVTKTSRK